MATAPMLSVEEIILQTDASGAPVRLEWVRGRLKGEALPASRHQKTVRAIERSIRPAPAMASDCACYSLADVLIRFPDPDQSLKRPDIAIFCSEPPDSDEALYLVPAAVIEVLSVGYEEKDLGVDGAAFYLTCGVADVLIVDPRARTILHYAQGQASPTTYAMPRDFLLSCGCQVQI